MMFRHAYQQMDYYDYRRPCRSAILYLCIRELSPEQHHMSISGRRQIPSRFDPDSPRLYVPGNIL